ncbi:MAG: cupredoxin domain-containing protein [Pyrinomonadaceae bacterium]
MKRLNILGIIFGGLSTALLLATCGNVPQIKTTDDSNAAVNANSLGETKGAKFSADFKTTPAEVKAGEPAELSFTVKNDKGEVVKDLPIVHEKPVHLLVVSDDLAEYYHIHPELQTDGSYRVQFTFPSGGSYKLYADYTPKDSAQVVDKFPLKVAGIERARVELKADEKLDKTIDGLRFEMKPDGELTAGKELMLNFKVYDAQTSKPVTDLEKYLGEYAHFVIISQDLSQFVHAHPMSRAEHSDGGHDINKMGATNGKTDESKPHSHDDKNAGEPATMQSPSEVSAHTTFPKSGLFKIFAQFQRAGKVITVPFVVNIKQGAKAAVKPVSEVQFPADAKRVILSKDGYEPSTVTFNKGEPMKIAFYRSDEENCGGEVVFKDLKITKKLPVGEVVVVDLSDMNDSEVSFACGMNMYKGKVLVQ